MTSLLGGEESLLGEGEWVTHSPRLGISGVEGHQAGKLFRLNFRLLVRTPRLKELLPLLKCLLHLNVKEGRIPQGEGGGFLRRGEFSGGGDSDMLGGGVQPVGDESSGGKINKF